MYNILEFSLNLWSDQLVPVPSLFFIGENGVPLEIIAGTVAADDLVSKINNVLTQAGKGNKSSSLNLIDAELKAAAASSNNNTIAASAESNIDNVQNNSNIDSATTESTTADTSNDKDVIEDSVQATTSLNVENKDNNEEPQESTEIKPDTQNKELTAEVCRLYII